MSDEVTFSGALPQASELVFYVDGKLALTITRSGELKFDSATDAAYALRREWYKLLGVTPPVADSAPKALNSGNG